MSRLSRGTCGEVLGHVLAVWNPKEGNSINDEPSRHVQASRPPSGKARLTGALGSGLSGAMVRSVSS